MEDLEVDRIIRRKVMEGLGDMTQVHRNDCPKEGLEWCCDADETNDYIERHPDCLKPCNCPTTDKIMRTYLEKHIQIQEIKKETSYRHIWITISLSEKVDIEKMKSFDPTILNCKGTETKWCLEFYGKELQFHPHIHLLIRTLKKLDKKRIISKLTKHFTIKNNFVDYEFSNSPMMYNKRDEYIQGIKKSEKAEQVKLDSAFRALNNIPQFYEL